MIGVDLWKSILRGGGRGGGVLKLFYGKYTQYLALFHTYNIYWTFFFFSYFMFFVPPSYRRVRWHTNVARSTAHVILYHVMCTFFSGSRSLVLQYRFLAAVCFIPSFVCVMDAIFYLCRYIYVWEDDAVPLGSFPRVYVWWVLWYDMAWCMHMPWYHLYEQLIPFHSASSLVYVLYLYVSYMYVLYMCVIHVYVVLYFMCCFYLLCFYVLYACVGIYWCVVYFVICMLVLCALRHDMMHVYLTIRMSQADHSHVTGVYDTCVWYIPWVSFVYYEQVIPFHSDLPKDELMSAFAPVGEGVVKIVVATNSAESSITLPDVDNVICLGSCKEVLHSVLEYGVWMCGCRQRHLHGKGREGKGCFCFLAPRIFMLHPSYFRQQTGPTLRLLSLLPPFPPYLFCPPFPLCCWHLFHETNNNTNPTDGMFLREDGVRFTNQP